MTRAKQLFIEIVFLSTSLAFSGCQGLERPAQLGAGTERIDQDRVESTEGVAEASWAGHEQQLGHVTRRQMVDRDQHLFLEPSQPVASGHSHHHPLNRQGPPESLEQLARASGLDASATRNLLAELNQISDPAIRQLLSSRLREEWQHSSSEPVHDHDLPNRNPDGRPARSNSETDVAERVAASFSDRPNAEPTTGRSSDPAGGHANADYPVSAASFQTSEAEVGRDRDSGAPPRSSSGEDGRAASKQAEVTQTPPDRMAPGEPELVAGQAKPLETSTWPEVLDEALAQLRRLQDTETAEMEPDVLVARMRLLQLIRAADGSATANFDELEPEQRIYWQRQLMALEALIGEDRNPVLGKRTALALRNLRAAISHLAAQSALDLRNFAVCESVSGFGIYEPFSRRTFKPGQEVVLYVEVENFVAVNLRDSEAGQPTRAQVFETEFEGSFQFLDESGREIADLLLPRDKQTCKNYRRDYYLAYLAKIPRDLSPGRYDLQLTIKDVKAGKYAQAIIDIQVQ